MTPFDTGGEMPRSRGLAEFMRDSLQRAGGRRMDKNTKGWVYTSGPFRGKTEEQATAEVERKWAVMGDDARGVWEKRVFDSQGPMERAASRPVAPVAVDSPAPKPTSKPAVDVSGDGANVVSGMISGMTGLSQGQVKGMLGGMVKGGKPTIALPRARQMDDGAGRVVRPGAATAWTPTKPLVSVGDGSMPSMLGELKLPPGKRVKSAPSESSGIIDRASSEFEVIGKSVVGSVSNVVKGINERHEAAKQREVEARRAVARGETPFSTVPATTAPRPAVAPVPAATTTAPPAPSGSCACYGEKRQSADSRFVWCFHANYRSSSNRGPCS